MTTPDRGRVRLSNADLLKRIARLAATPPTIPDADASVHVDDATPGDARLIDTCRAVVPIQTRKLALFIGPDLTVEDVARDSQLSLIDIELRPLLDIVAASVPTTWTGHTIRAAILLLVDGGSLYAGGRQGGAADTLLAAVVHDLAAS